METFAAKLAILLMSVVLVQASSSRIVELTAQQKQELLDKHNSLRRKVAEGSISGQSSAANMVPLKWDDRLEETAANWAGKCEMGHDSAADRAVGAWSWVGQNWAGGSQLSLDGFVQLWFDEVNDYHLDQNVCNSGKVCGHYTQVCWAKTTHVGCALAQCSGVAGACNYHLVCNYGPGGNFDGEKPYVAGSPASQCQGKFTLNAKGVCALPDQTQGVSATCTLSAASCVNGGSFNAQECSCECPEGFFGAKCEMTCSDNSGASQCQQWKSGYPDLCTWTFGDQQCRKFCGLCHSPGEDVGAVNRLGLISRVPNF